MRRTLALLPLVLSVAGCSTVSSTPTTMGVDGAPEIVKNAYLTVARQASTLAGYDATNDQWIVFAREVCAGGFEDQDELADFVTERAGSAADVGRRQMWSTVAGAASSSFCPIG